MNLEEIVGKNFKAHDGLIYYCDSYDPRMGYWMTEVDNPGNRRNVSERAIGSSFILLVRKAEDYKVGDTIRFMHSKKPLIIKKGLVIGHDTSDRVLVRFEYHDGIFGEGSIHLNLIIPKQIEKVV